MIYFLLIFFSQDTQFVKQHTTELKQLMDARKAIAIDVANVISKVCLTVNWYINFK